MQLKGMHKGIYTLYSYASKHLYVKARREKHQKTVKQWDRLKSTGMDSKYLPEYSGCSRATYYRAKKRLKEIESGKFPASKRPKHLNKPKWGESEKQLVLRIRRENPTYGKAKITTILKRDHEFTMSESTVGRILTHLKEKKLITKSISAVRARRKRNFNRGHAKPWKYKDYNKMELGERVQIDHMSVCKNGIRVKHFQAWERRSKYIHAHVYSNATSRSAKRFLEEFIELAPFKIKSIQVDGGSEFMLDFEQACADKGIPLIVLPPAKPTYNGGVERGNRTFREEFYLPASMQADSVGAIQYELKKAVKKYNEYRPHFSLDGLTPIQYIENSNLEAAA